MLKWWTHCTLAWSMITLNANWHLLNEIEYWMDPDWGSFHTEPRLIRYIEHAWSRRLICKCQDSRVMLRYLYKIFSPTKENDSKLHVYGLIDNSININARVSLICRRVRGTISPSVVKKSPQSIQSSAIVRPVFAPTVTSSERSACSLLSLPLNRTPAWIGTADHQPSLSSARSIRISVSSAISGGFPTADEFDELSQKIYLSWLSFVCGW